LYDDCLLDRECVCVWDQNRFMGQYDVDAFLFRGKRYWGGNQVVICTCIETWKVKPANPNTHYKLMLPLACDSMHGIRVHMLCDNVFIHEDRLL
jgi:hypothetical protein